MKNRLLLTSCFVLCLLMLTAQDRKTKSLFDGKTLAGWRSYQNKPADSWFVKNGMLVTKEIKTPIQSMRI